MKKNVLILLLLFCTVAVFAQTPLKVHGDGRISLQSASTSYGIIFRVRLTAITNTQTLQINSSMAISKSDVNYHYTKVRSRHFGCLVPILHNTKLTTRK